MDILKSWKTTLIGIVVIALCVGFFMGMVPLDKFVGVIGGLLGIGQMLSKDSNVSGV